MFRWKREEKKKASKANLYKLCCCRQCLASALVGSPCVLGVMLWGLLCFCMLSWRSQPSAGAWVPASQCGDKAGTPGPKEEARSCPGASEEVSPQPAWGV